MKFTEAITKVVQTAIQESKLIYLYRNDRGWCVSGQYCYNWLFRAYPGGRTEFSADGTRFLEEIQDKMSSDGKYITAKITVTLTIKDLIAQEQLNDIGITLEEYVEQLNEEESIMGLADGYTIVKVEEVNE